MQTHEGGIVPCGRESHQGNSLGLCISIDVFLLAGYNMRAFENKSNLNNPLSMRRKEFRPFPLPAATF